jgi:hypothetical protein
LISLLQRARQPTARPGGWRKSRRRPRALIIIVAVLVQGAATLDAQPLYCSPWQGITTCSSPDGYVSHETEWQGRTNGWDNRGETWSTSRRRDIETTTGTPPEH